MLLPLLPPSLLTKARVLAAVEQQMPQIAVESASMTWISSRTMRWGFPLLCVSRQQQQQQQPMRSGGAAQNSSLLLREIETCGHGCDRMLSM